MKKAVYSRSELVDLVNLTNRNSITFSLDVYKRFFLFFYEDALFDFLNLLRNIYYIFSSVLNTRGHARKLYKSKCSKLRVSFFSRSH